MATNTKPKMAVRLTESAIMIALVDGKPKTLNLKEILEEYLKHQEEVVTRRTKYDLNKAEERAHILEGLLSLLIIVLEIVPIVE